MCTNFYVVGKLPVHTEKTGGTSNGLIKHSVVARADVVIAVGVGVAGELRMLDVWKNEWLEMYLDSSSRLQFTYAPRAAIGARSRAMKVDERMVVVLG